MKPIDTMWSVVNDVMSAPKFVTIDNEAIAKANVIGSKEQSLLGPPFSEWSDQDINCRCQMIWYELIASSINYMYWYGGSEIRPGGANAVQMYKLLSESFEEHNSNVSIGLVIKSFARKLVLGRFPYSEYRFRHLMDLVQQYNLINQFVYELALSKQEHYASARYQQKHDSMEGWISELITTIPNFGQDIFLKRAFLFFGMMNRRYGWFAEIINELPIPADYQVPKMLRWMGCIAYSDDLQKKIDKEEIIPAGSRMEIEIRAASILACKKLADAAKCSMNDVDAFLWGHRKLCNDKFHLTITTDY